MKLTTKNIKNFWKKVNKTDTCWEWTAYRLKDGYGRFGIGNSKDTYKMVSAHRVSWTIHFGPIPEGLYVLHHCDNPPCVNPEHLHLGTQQDNIDERTSRGRGIQLSGEEHGMAKLTQLEVNYIRCLYEQGGIKQTELGVMFNCDHSSISYIVNNKIWKKESKSERAN